MPLPRQAPLKKVAESICMDRKSAQHFSFGKVLSGPAKGLNVALYQHDVLSVQPMSFQNSTVGVDSATITLALHHILDQLDQIKANQLQLSEHLGLTLQGAPAPIQSAPAAPPIPKPPQSRQDAPGSFAKPSWHRPLPEVRS
jgi:hypothetical protein